MASKNRVGNRSLESCIGTGAQPKYQSDRRCGTCWACGKIVQKRADGTLRTHGRMVGAIWHPSTQTFVTR